MPVCIESVSLLLMKFMAFSILSNQSESASVVAELQ